MEGFYLQLSRSTNVLQSISSQLAYLPITAVANKSNSPLKPPPCPYEKRPSAVAWLQPTVWPRTWPGSIALNIIPENKPGGVNSPTLLKNQFNYFQQNPRFQAPLIKLTMPYDGRDTV
jgi:hypothetical protein